MDLQRVDQGPFELWQDDDSGLIFIVGNICPEAGWTVLDTVALAAVVINKDGIVLKNRYGARTKVGGLATIRVQGFLYSLMRDQVVPGAVEKLVLDFERLVQKPGFSNEHLAAYAKELTDRLFQGSFMGGEDAAS